MRAKCPHCKTVLDVSRFAPGTVLACANCQQNFQVPVPVSQPEAVSIVPTPKKPHTKGTARGWKQHTVIVCAVVVFFLISGCCIISSVLDYTENIAPRIADPPPIADSKLQPNKLSIRDSLREAEFWREFESRKELGDSYYDDKDYQNARECYLDCLFVLEAIEEINPDSENPTSGLPPRAVRISINQKADLCKILSPL